MKWVTRERARVDRIACPWLVSRFIDKNPTFLFVPAGQVTTVAEREGAIPYDIPGVALGHHGERCSFDAFLDHLKRLTFIRRARGREVWAHRSGAPSAGVYCTRCGH